MECSSPVNSSSAIGVDELAKKLQDMKYALIGSSLLFLSFPALPALVTLLALVIHHLTKHKEPRKIFDIAFVETKQHHWQKQPKRRGKKSEHFSLFFSGEKQCSVPSIYSKSHITSL